MTTVYAYRLCLPSVPTCLYLPVCAYLSMLTVYAYRLCLPVCAYLSMPTVCAYLSMPTVCACRLCYCLCLPVCNLGERSARSKAPPNLIVCIDSNRSLRPFAGCTFERWSSGVPPYEALIRFGDGPISKLWFNSIDRLIESFVAFAGRSFERWPSGSGDGRLVLATVVWFWRRSSGSGDSPLLAAVLVPS